MDERDERDFEAFVHLRWARLVRTARLLGCSAAEAEDVAQAALARCWRHWRRVRGADDPDAYAHRVLINTWNSSRRRRWWGERATADLPDAGTPDPTEAYDRLDAVVRSLGRLPEAQRTAVVLRYYAGLDERQLAAALGVAPGTVKSRLSRALTTLAEDPGLAELRGTP